jgi:5-methylcytosine-specific restriction endonuclease McrA
MQNHRSFYWSDQWVAFRRLVLAERLQCEVPGCHRLAVHLDHVVAIRDGGAPLEPANVMALCVGHHSSKTAQVNGGFGNRRRGEAVLRVRGCDREGRPLDPGHRWNR